METVITLEERKRARVEEIRAGFARLRDALAGYGRAHGGKFWIYGSAAAGRVHFESDIDILVDFPEAKTSAALTFVEETSLRYKLKADAQPKSWCMPAFLERISKDALILP